jgi:hypothetical protein
VRKQRLRLAWWLGEVKMQLEAHAHTGDVGRADAFTREYEQRTKGDKYMCLHEAHVKLRVQDEKGLARL